ncbi:MULTISPECIES: hypothetical protein [Mesorhizobium]|nr:MULTISPECIES: hypothetical protein [Mesorhizobium]
MIATMFRWGVILGIIGFVGGFASGQSFSRLMPTRVRCLASS